MNLSIRRWRSATAAAVVATALSSAPALASSHMDAPLITFDDAANTTDVYAFVAEQGGAKYLATALAVYPFEDPGIGPNNFRFDDDVRYEIHVATGDDLAQGRPTLTYRFDFETTRRDPTTILQAFLDVVDVTGSSADPYSNLNQLQTYTVTRVDPKAKKKKDREVVLGTGFVPPNNQGNVTPLYNQGNSGENPAKDGVANAGELDAYTAAAIASFPTGHHAFAGQRDDGFYADIQAIFDGLTLRNDGSSFDSQGGFNVHTIALNIPVAELGGDLQVAGVYATTSRRRVTVFKKGEKKTKGKFVQIGRQGNPLFCEGFVALQDKDLYNRTSPEDDVDLFDDYARTPELAQLVNQFVFQAPVAPENNREDLVGIFIPDLIRVDLSTGPARLAGGGEGHPTNPDDVGFHRLGVFGPGGGDTLVSALTGGDVPGGWPNGRRFGDDVVDIAVTALINDLSDPNAPITVADGIDSVSANDIAYNKTFPYAATPLNGRNHPHH